jgi:hypothetical protein
MFDSRLHLGKVEFWEVHDLDVAHPDETIAHLEREVMDLIERLAITPESQS